MAKKKKPGDAEKAFEFQEVRTTTARQIATIGPDSDLWIYAAANGLDPAMLKLRIREGALVRVIPPADVAAIVVSSLVEAIAHQAASVKVMPAAQGDVLPVKAEVVQKPTRRSAREVVEALVEEVPSVDREALREVVGLALAEAGL